MAREITDRTLDYTFSNVEKWNSYNNNGESWRTLRYMYEDGYLVGVGVRYNSPANWSQETIAINGKNYALSYTPATAEIMIPSSGNMCFMWQIF